MVLLAVDVDIRVLSAKIQKGNAFSNKSKSVLTQAMVEFR
jgi:hypothetical protein